MLYRSNYITKNQISIWRSYKLKFDQLYCINEQLANDVLLVAKILINYDEALWPNKLEIRHACQILTNNRQILVLSQLSKAELRQLKSHPFICMRNLINKEVGNGKLSPILSLKMILKIEYWVVLVSSISNFFST